MANSIAWKVNQDPGEGESFEAFIDRITADVNLTDQEQLEIPELIRKSSTVFTSESKNLLYFTRKRIVDKFLGHPPDSRLSASTQPSLAERNKLAEAEKRKELERSLEFEKIKSKIEGGLPVSYNKNVVSDSEAGAFVRQLELDKVRNQLANSESLSYNESLVSVNDIEDLKSEVATARFSWLHNRIRPQAQPYGVSNYGAENLVADWLVYLGLQEVVVTQASQDGGIDVQTATHVCQVKYYKNNPVSVQEVREIFGVASALGKAAMIFTSSDLTAAAYEFANQVGVVAVQFHVEASFLVGLNYSGKKLLEEGEYE